MNVPCMMIDELEGARISNSLDAKAFGVPAETDLLRLRQHAVPLILLVVIRTCLRSILREIRGAVAFKANCVRHNDHSNPQNIDHWSSCGTSSTSGSESAWTPDHDALELRCRERSCPSSSGRMQL